MPVDASIYGQIQPVRLNTPFESLGQIMQLRNQQEAARGLAEQRGAIADERRQKADAARLEAQQAAQFKALWSRTDPATGQPVMPTLEESASIIGPENAAKVFKGLEEVQKAKWDNQQAAVQGVASILDGIEAWPAADRQTAYDGARKTLIAQGKLKPEDAPERYNASWVAEQMRRAQTAQQRFERDKAAQGPQTVAPGVGVLQPDGTYKVPVPKEETSGSKPSSVQEYEYAKTQGFNGSFEDYQNADANRKQRAASERAPYFTFQTTYDAQGRPDGAIRFDARGGPPQRVSVAEMGGQLKPPPGDTGKQAIGNEVSTAQLDRLIGMFNRGGKAFIGPVEGRARSVGQQIPGVPVNKTFSEFEAATAAFRNSVIKAITGAAMSEPEAQRIRQQIPELTDKPDVWQEKAKQTRQNLQDLAKALAAKSASGATKDPMGIR